MQIILESLDELRALVAVLDPAFTKSNAAAAVSPQQVGRARRPTPEQESAAIDAMVVSGAINVADADRHRTELGLVSDETGPLVRSETDAAAAEVPSVDATGRSWDERIDSSNHGFNADGTWRARRKVDPALRNQVLAEWEARPKAEEAPDAADEPVATETHALPKDAPETEEASAPAAGTADLSALIEGSAEAAQDASDSHIDLVKACQGFVSEHGHAAFNALKAAVAPLEGSEHGKSLPQFTPDDRRRMQACIANYALFV